VILTYQIYSAVTCHLKQKRKLLKDISFLRVQQVQRELPKTAAARRQVELKYLSTATTFSITHQHQCVSQSLCSTYITGLVVLVAVGKHELEVINALLSIDVVEQLQALPYCPHVHRSRYHLVVVLAPHTDARIGQPAVIIHTLTDITATHSHTLKHTHALVSGHHSHAH